MVWTLALSISIEEQVDRIGAYAGIAACVGLAILSVLYFAQAREVRRLREWAGRAPERAQELEARVMAGARDARADAHPVAPVPAPTAPSVEDGTTDEGAGERPAAVNGDAPVPGAVPAGAVPAGVAADPGPDGDDAREAAAVAGAPPEADGETRVHDVERPADDAARPDPVLIPPGAATPAGAAAAAAVAAGAASPEARAGTAGAQDRPGTIDGAAGAQDRPGTIDGAAGPQDRPGTADGAAGPQDRPGTADGAAGPRDRPGTADGAGSQDRPGATDGAGSQDRPGATDGGMGPQDRPGTADGAAGSQDGPGTGGGAADPQDRPVTAGDATGPAAAPSAPLAGSTAGSPPDATDAAASPPDTGGTPAAAPAARDLTSGPGVPAAASGFGGASPATPAGADPVGPGRPSGTAPSMRDDDAPVRLPRPAALPPSATVAGRQQRPAAPLRNPRPTATPRRPGGAAPPPPRPGRNRTPLYAGAGLLAAAGLAFGVVALTGGDEEPQRRAANTATTPTPTPDRAATPARGDTTVAVLNGTTQNGLASTISQQLVSAGYRKGDIATNTDQSLQETVVLYAGRGRSAARDVARILEARRVEALDPATATRAGQGTKPDVVVVVGADQAP